MIFAADESKCLRRIISFGAAGTICLSRFDLYYTETIYPFFSNDIISLFQLLGPFASFLQRNYTDLISTILRPFASFL